MKSESEGGIAIPERGQRMPEQLPPPLAAHMIPHLPRMGPRQIELRGEGIEDKEQPLADTTTINKIKPPFSSPKHSHLLIVWQQIP